MANKNGSLTPSVFYLKRASLCDEVRQIYVSLFSLLGNLFNHFTSNAAYYLSSSSLLILKIFSGWNDRVCDVHGYTEITFIIFLFV